jgi:hypothetical protein
MKDISVILSHADTEDKLILLEDSVDNLLRQGKKVLISSHIDVPKYIVDKVDFLICDKENPLIRYDEYLNSFNIVYVWSSFDGYRQDFPIEFNHAFAVHKLILNACAIAKSNGYETIHFINYDYVIKDSKVLEKHNEILNRYDVVSYDWVGFGANHRENISSALFSCRIDNFYEKIKTVNSKEEYCKWGSPIYEDFLYTICKELMIYYIPISDVLEKNVIAAKSILDNFVINLEDGTALTIHVSKENEDNYIFISNPVQRRVFINGYQFETSNNLNLFAITEEQLKNTIKIEFPELDIVREFNDKTPVALAQIEKRELINFDMIQSKSKVKRVWTIEEYCDETKAKRWNVINFLAEKFNAVNYLEIGVNDGSCIRQINIPHKDGVDPFPGGEIGGCEVPEINYEMTSDDFFNNYAEIKYDIIFIDGLHHSEQVDKDIYNSLRFLQEGGFIILHDCNPPNYDVQVVPRQTGIWNGDVWKSIVKLRCQRPDLEVSVIDTDWGLGVVRKGHQNLLSYGIHQCLDWDFFDNNREEILNLISVEEFFKKY